MSHPCRARGRVRRYIRANRLDRLLTLTYRVEPTARAAVVADLRKFFRRLGEQLGRQAAVAIIERGKTTGRLHVHLALGRFVAKQWLARLWGHGFVDIRRSARGQGQWRQRQLAGYLSKYLSKEADELPEGGPKERAYREHRYLVTQGFTPRTYRLRYGCREHGLERLLGVYGAPDYEVDFGDPEADPVYGTWFTFPDRLLHPPPRPPK